MTQVTQNAVDAIDMESRHLQEIKAIVARTLPYKRILAYGSCVTWQAHEWSDVDMVACGASDRALRNAINAFEESNLPFAVQLLQWESIPQKFKDNIMQKYFVLQKEDDWGIFKLGDVAILNYGKSLLKKNRVTGNIPVYGSGGVIGWHNEYFVKNRGIVVGRKGNVGSVFKSEQSFFPIDTVFYISTDNTDCDLSFLFYQLCTLGLNRLDSDSAVPGLNRNIAYQQYTRIPLLPEQKAIAEVLSSFDDKIDLLRCQNKTLENIAQTIFRERFIKNADDRWEKTSIVSPSLCTILTSGIHRFEGEKIYLATGDVVHETIRNQKTKINFLERPARANMQPVEYSVWFAKKGGVRKILMFNDIDNKNIDRFILSTGFSGLKTNPQNHYYIYCFILRNEFQSIKDSLISGSVQPDINNDGIKKILLSNPSAHALDTFNKQVTPLFDKITSNQSQIHTLAQLRDTLLPHLMSGTVRVAH